MDDVSILLTYNETPRLLLQVIDLLVNVAVVKFSRFPMAYLDAGATA